MKGLVFTKFIVMVEELFELEASDRITSKEELRSQDPYSSIKNDSHTDLLLMIVKQLNQITVHSF